MNQDKYTEICNKLERLRLGENPFWNAGSRTVEEIILCIQRISNCRMLEIGTSNGFTALRLAPTLRSVHGSLITIESHQERGDLSEENFRLAGVEDIITLIRGHAPEILSSLSGIFDLVFLDATKYEHVSYVEQLIPLLSSNAIVIADNIFSHEEVMKPFVEYMQSLPNFSVEIKKIDTGLLVAQKQE